LSSPSGTSRKLSALSGSFGRFQRAINVFELTGENPMSKKNAHEVPFAKGSDAASDPEKIHV